MPHIHDVHVAEKEITGAPPGGGVIPGLKATGVVFKIFQGINYKFYIVDNPQNRASVVLCHADRGGFLPQFAVPNPSEHIINNPRTDEWFIFDGEYVNHILDPTGGDDWLDVYTRVRDQNGNDIGNARVRFERHS